MADDFLNRYVGIAREATYGTDPGSGYIYGEVDDESLHPRLWSSDLGPIYREDLGWAFGSRAVPLICSLVPCLKQIPERSILRAISAWPFKWMTS